MTSIRLVAAVVLLCCGLAFAQGNQEKSVPSSGSAALLADSGATENWDVTADLSNKAVPQDPLTRLESLDSNQFPTFKKDPPPGLRVFYMPDIGSFVIPPDGGPDGSICLKIRSYVMRRDSKNSDSTHLAGYSTCQPARKFQLRTTVGSPETQK